MIYPNWYMYLKLDGILIVLASLLCFFMLNIFRDANPVMYKFQHTLTSRSVDRDIHNFSDSNAVDSYKQKNDLNIWDFTSQFYSHKVMQSLLQKKNYKSDFKPIKIVTGLKSDIKKFLAGEYRSSREENEKDYLKARLKSMVSYSIENRALRFTILTARPEYDIELYELWLLEVFDQYLANRIEKIKKNISFFERTLRNQKILSSQKLNDLKWELIELERTSYLGLNIFSTSRPRLVGEKIGSNYFLENFVISICLWIFLIFYVPLLRCIIKR